MTTLDMYSIARRCDSVSYGYFCLTIKCKMISNRLVHAPCQRCYKTTFVIDSASQSYFLLSLFHCTQTYKMTSSSLPSFVELMASLGLSADNTGSRPGSADSSRRSSYSASPSASPPLLHVPSKPSRREKSPAIRVTQYDAANEAGDFKRRASAGNTRASRFMPYASVVSHFKIAQCKI